MHQDYLLVERAIEYLEAHYRQQPSLAELAAAVHMSEGHFQRLFKRWAGISPKRFLQFLTVEHAKRLLTESRALLDVSLDTGLSGPSRLHDLFVSLEAVTPGEFRSGGSGLEIAYGAHDSPFGECLLALTERGVCGLFFLSDGDAAPHLAELERAWPRARLRQDSAETGAVVGRIFDDDGGREDRPLNLLVRGTNFQVKVWQALLRIPPGQVLSYEDVAEWVGSPSGGRAVGQAVGHNPISYVIPCHRIIRKSGAFGYYGGGPARKRAMLGWEAARRFGEADGG